MKTTTEHDFSRLHESFQALIRQPGQMFQILDLLPLPIEVFAPDGLSVFCNRACVQLNGGKEDGSYCVGKYNLLQDPVCDAIFGHENLERAFRGEFYTHTDFQVPIDDLVERGEIEEKPFETAFMDVHMMPIFDGDRLVNVMAVFVPKRMYKGLPQVAKAKEYIDSHWREKFNYGAVSSAANLSRSSLYPLFRQHVGMTLKDYYDKVKLDHIKEKLQDKSLSIDEAFSACGADNRGWFAKIFKGKTGMTPTEYRESIGII